MLHSQTIAALLLMTVLWQTTSHAEVVAKQASSDASGQALRKAQGVLRQLSEEKAALETEKAALSQEKTALQEQIKKLEGVIKQLEPLQAEVTLQKTNAENLRTAAGTLTAQLNNAHDNERLLKQTQQDIVSQAKAIQSDNQQLVAMVKEREQWIKQCGEKNRAVVTAAKDLATQYQEGKSIWTTLSEVEPFTGIGNVDKQNTTENYQFKLEDLKVTAFESETK